MNVVTFNLGSSSLKYALHSVKGESADERYSDTIRTNSNPAAAAAAARQAIGNLTGLGVRIDAIGHRIVFGGEDDSPSIITTGLLERLESLASIDPLHAPGALAVARQAGETLEGTLNVACFDTAFFRDLPETAKALFIPVDGDPLLRRYGFHGLSYESAVHQLSTQLKEKTVIAHLGSGCSVAALSRGRPADVTMGFSPLGGVIMATRPGDADPGLLLYLLEEGGLDKAGLRDMLENRSGLSALSGGEADLQRLCERSDARARFAVQIFVRSIAKAIASLSVTLGGIDMLVFTGGIGEHNDRIRKEICEHVRFLNSACEIHVVPADENAMIARHTARVAGPELRAPSRNSFFR